MNYLGKVLNNCKYIYNEINAATLTGAIDVVVVEQPDGTYTCSPFHVRFGKMGVLRSKEKIVDIEMNGEPVDIHMKLGESGEAFFVEVVEEEMVPPHLATSPIPPDSGEETSDWINRLDEEELGVGDEKEVMASSTPKTFKAEKVEEETVLTNKQSAEFRPITGQASSTSLSGQDTDFTKEDSPSADERLPIKNGNTTTVTNNSNNNNKRKRRKKSTKKKAGSQGGSSNDKKEVTNGGSVGGKTGIEEANPEPIFHLEDLDTTGDGERHQHQGQEELCQHSEEDSKALDLSGVPIEGRDLHFFSDTEITPGSRFGDGSLELEPGFRLLTGSHIAAFPRDTCDFAPIQSDSELETKRLENGGEERNGPEEQTQSQWKWGELPTSASLEGDKQESQRWMLHNMLGFMKKTKHMRHKTEAEGIYLSELNSEDPEMAALYFPSNYRQAVVPSDYRDECREEDAESGNGPSLPQSPHSVEGAVCGPKVRQVDDKWLPEDLALSVCGPNPSPEQFEESQVSYSEFMVNPNLLSSPKLVVRIDGKYYPWRTAAPLLVSFLFFHKSLPQEVVTRLSESETEADERLEKGKPPKKAYSSWFYWSRNNPPPQPAIPQDGQDTIISGSVPAVAKMEEAKTQPEEVTPTTENLTKSETDPAVTVTESTPATGEPQALDEPTTPEDEDHGDGKTEDITKDEDSRGPDYNSDKYRKTLRLTSAQIASLKLHPGANEVQFSVTTAYQGTSKCKCFLFCWRYDDKIVVSDIDGTITKSDVLGHILPIVGKDWAQSGVAKLFTKIRENGYKLLYLSARAIGQSRLTRDYLKSIKQEDLGLPEGPMLLNPTSLLTAFHTEVIEKKPEEFKISCLRDIQALFPLHIKPFYAGYGNKINDVWAYQAIGIPIFRIFTINHKGELKHELTQTFQSTYTNMSHLVDQIFPPSKPYPSEDYSQFVYWREPIMDIERELASNQL